MSEFPPKKNKVSIDILTNWVSIIMALIFALPSLGVFLGIFYGVGNLPLAAILGFGTHFVILAFSNRIAKYLDKVLN